jgi:ketosteroid isomerase-like protein
MEGKAMRQCWFALALVAASAAPAAAHVGSKSASQQSVLQRSAGDAAAVVDVFHAALRRGDLSAASALLADDALIFEAGGVERTKAEYQAKHLPADAVFSRGVPARLVGRSGRSDNRTAWIASEGRVTGTLDGKKVDRVTTETMVLRRSRGAWKIIHIHWSSGLAP